MDAHASRRITREVMQKAHDNSQRWRDSEREQKDEATRRVKFDTNNDRGIEKEEAECPCTVSEESDRIQRRY